MIFLFTAFLTIAVEALFWCCFKKYRNWRFLLWSAAVNFWSNLTLNLIMLFLLRRVDTLLSYKIVIGEVLVVAAEFLLFCLIEKTDRRRLFVLTLIANIITYSLSFII